jgi:hypothetical protein
LAQVGSWYVTSSNVLLVGVIWEEVNQNKRWMYKVQCDCGKVEIKRKDWVISGRTTSCKSCASKRTAKNYPPPTNRKGCQGLSGTHFLSIKNGALLMKTAMVTINR